MIGLRAYRGQPLVALLLVLGGWVTMRSILWEGTPSLAASLPPVDIVAASVDEPIVAAAYVEPSPEQAREYSLVHMSSPNRRGRALRSPPEVADAATQRGYSPRRVSSLSPPSPALQATSWRLTEMARTAGLPLPRQMIATAAAPQAVAPAKTVSTDSPSRWSADAWALLREGTVAALGVGPATYGASQAGAVLRYRLAPTDPHRPAAYVRVTSALDYGGDQEIAAGFLGRPITGLPVVAAAELRAGRLAGRTMVRPAAFAYTELAPFPLGHSLTGELYTQAGYVGGSFATPFVDGQFRADRSVMRLGPAELRAGAGIWGGAQRGASRLDVGPTMALGIAGRRGAIRTSIDWRFRVVGNAVPASGPAVTLSAGF